MQDPNADTEWNDVLRAKGILPPKVIHARLNPREAHLRRKDLYTFLEASQLYKRVCPFVRPSVRPALFSDAY